MTAHSWVLAATILLPLLAAPVVAALAHWRQERTWVGLSVLEIEVALCLWLLSLAGSEVPSIPLASATLLGEQFSLRLAADGLSAVFALVISLVVLAGAVFDAGRPTASPLRPPEQPVLFLATGVLMAVVASANLLTLYALWQLGILAVVLVVALGVGARSLAAASRYFALNEAGALALLFVIALSYTGRQGEPVAGWLPIGDENSRRALLGLLMLAVAAGVAAAPLHSWLPTAGEGLAPSQVSFLYGVTNKAGLYLLARAILAALSQGRAGDWMLPLAVLGGLTLAVAAFNVAAQRDVRGTLVFVGVGQTGYVLLGLGTGESLGVIGALFCAVAQTLALTLLVLSLALLRERTGSDEPEALGGLASDLPLAALGFVVAGLSLVGIPPWSGFVGQALIFHGLAAKGPGWQMVAVTVGLVANVVTAAALARLGGRVFLGERPASLPLARAGELLPRVAVGTLIGLCLAVGVFPRLLLGPVVSPLVGARALGGWADLAVAPLGGAAPVVIWSPLFVSALLAFPLLAVGLTVLRLGYVRYSDIDGVDPELGTLASALSPQDEAAPALSAEPLAIVRWWHRAHAWTAAGNADVYIAGRRLLSPVTEVVERAAGLTLRVLLR